MKKNYYEILEVSPNASMEIIKAAYRSLAKRYHTDNGSEDNEKMVEINEAYAILSDEAKRAEYDAQFESSTFANATKTYASGDEVSVDVLGKKVTFAKRELTGMMVHNMFNQSTIPALMQQFEHKLKKGSVLQVSEGRIVTEPLTNLQDYCITVRNVLSEGMIKILAHFGIYTYSVETVKTRYDWSELFDMYNASLKEMKEYLVASYHSQGKTSTDRDLDAEYAELKWRQNSSLVANLTYSIANEIKDSLFDDIDDYQSEVNQSRRRMNEEFVFDVKQIVLQSAYTIERILFACIKDSNILIDDDIASYIIRNDACDNILSNLPSDKEDRKNLLIKAFDYNPFNSSIYSILLNEYFDNSESVVKFVRDNKYNDLKKYGLLKVSYEISSKDEDELFNCFDGYTVEEAVNVIICEKIRLITKLENDKTLSKETMKETLEKLQCYCEKYGCSMENFNCEGKLDFIFKAKENWKLRDELMQKVTQVKSQPIMDVIKFYNRIREDERYKDKSYIYKDAENDLSKYIFEYIKNEVEDTKNKGIAEIEAYILNAKADYKTRFLESYETDLKAVVEEKAGNEVRELYNNIDKTDIEAMKLFIEKLENDYGKYKCSMMYVKIVSEDIENEQERLIIAELGGDFGESMDSKVATALIKKVKDTQHSDVIKKRVCNKIKKQLFRNNMPCINKIMDELANQFPAVKDSKSGFCIYEEQPDCVEGEKKTTAIIKIEAEIDNLGGVEQPILSNLKTGLLDLSGRESGFSITQKSLLYYEKGIINRILLKDISSFSIQKKLLLTDLVVTTSNGVTIKLPNKFPKEIINYVPNILTEAVRLVRESSIYDE